MAGDAIHDKYDDHIFLETGIVSTFMVGIFSTLFVDMREPRWLCWIMFGTFGAFFLSSLFMFLCAFACFPYFKSLDSAKHHRAEGKQNAANDKARFWAGIRKKHRIAFFLSVFVGTASMSIRFWYHFASQ